MAKTGIFKFFFCDDSEKLTQSESATIALECGDEDENAICCESHLAEIFYAEVQLAVIDCDVVAFRPWPMPVPTHRYNYHPDRRILTRKCIGKPSLGPSPPARVL